MSKSTIVAFDTTVTATGNKTGIVVPNEVIIELAAGKRPAVVVKVNGHEYRNTVGVMGGKCMISISSAIREATGLKGGDAIHVELAVADSPREGQVPTGYSRQRNSAVVGGHRPEKGFQVSIQ